MKQKKTKQKTSKPLRVPKALFRAQSLAQQGRYYDQRGQYAQAVTYYLKGIEAYTTLLEKHPKMPFWKMYERETRLLLHRVHQLKPQVLGGSAPTERPPDPPNSPDTGNPPKRSKDDEQYAEMRARIQECRIDPDPNLTGANVFGLEEIMEHLRETIMQPLEFPELLRRKIPGIPRSVLIFGPPRCGKTFAVKAVTSEAKLPLYAVTPGKLFQKWMGESQKMVQVLYEEAWEEAPSVIFFDEFDKFFGKPQDQRRRTPGTEASLTGMQVQGELLQYLSGVKTPAVNNTVTIAATNFPWHLEASMVARFDRVLYVHPPSSYSIEKLIVRNLDCIPHTLTANHVEWMAYELEMYTPSEIETICFRAYQLAIQKARKAKTRPRVGIMDIKKAIPFLNPMMELRGKKGVGTTFFRQWNHQFGIPVIDYYESEWEKHPYFKSNPIRLDVLDDSEPVKWKKE